MVNKTIKAVVAACALISGSQILPVAGGDNTVATQCVQGGQNVTVNGGQNCTITAGSQGGAKKGRARGDIVALDTAGITPIRLGKSGSIKVPQTGEVDIYSFNGMKIAIASFNLADTSMNPPVSPALKRIIDMAAAKNKWAQSMVWVGRQLPGETNFTEVTESYSDLADLSQAQSFKYNEMSKTQLNVTLPPYKGFKNGLTFSIDFQPIVK